MFSQLGPLFKTQIRQTESNDTRQHIPHEERDNPDKKKEDQGRKSTVEEKWTDDTVVSVVALRSFLINFLKTLPGGEESSFLKNRDNTQISSRPKETGRPMNTQNAKAVRAYQTMASHSHSEITGEEPPSENDSAADTLQSKELHDIHTLIRDLEYIESKNIRDLNILKADSFIEGMKQAILLARSKI